MTRHVAAWGMRAPTATLTIDDFEPRDAVVLPLGDGQVLCRTRYISLDPYLSRAMREWQGEVPGWADGTIHGRVLAEVMEPRATGFAPGDHVWGVGRWQKLNIFDGSALELIAPQIDPPSLALGVLGRSGITAWVGLHLALPQVGETILISAATGPVGSVVGQLAKARGCRVIGSAGGAEKCLYAVERLGFDACIDHRDPALDAALSAAAPDGVDILFENVGGPSLDPALPHMRQGGRIILCGLAAHYLSEDPLKLRNFKTLLYQRISLRGFVTADHRDLFPAALAELQAGVLAGTIAYSETVIDGLEHAPEAFLAMLHGAGIGKRLIRIE